MRSTFPEIVERGRVRTGEYASPPGKPFGAFFVVNAAGRRLKVIASDGRESGWDHVSVSLAKRCPTWDEMSWIKHLFFYPEEVVVQFHPAASKHINHHPYCLHLWRCVAGLATPPSILV